MSYQHDQERPPAVAARTSFEHPGAVSNDLHGTAATTIRRIELRDNPKTKTMIEPLKHKHHSLTGRISPALLHDAFRAVKRNKGKAGVDRVSIELFARQLDQNLAALLRDLKDGSFRPAPVLRRYIDKGGGKKRPLGIPTVRDRVAQEVLRRLLSPLFEPLFHDNSHGFRPGRSCHSALERMLEIWRSGHRHVLDADISGFFDNIPHDVVLRGLRNVVADGNILNLVERFLTAGVLEDGVVQTTTLGTPQGGVLSPLLANIALNFLDWHLDELGLRCVRYADDFVVLCRTELQAKEARTRIEAFLTQLGLSLSPAKTKVTTFLKGFTFLGFDVQSHSVKMRAKSVENYQARVRELTTRSHNLEAEVVAKLNSVNRGVQRYFGTSFSTCVTQFRELDEWVRMRLRCQKLKRKSRTHNCRINDAYIQRMGLVTLSELHRQSRQTVRGCPSAEAIPSPARPRRKTGSAAGPPGARKTHAGK
jgi:group II intron reverse transcriptase/maturase